MTEQERLRRENERLRRELAYAQRGQVIPGSGRAVPPKALDTVVTFRVDGDTLRALLELTEAFGTTRGEVLREAVRRMANGRRNNPHTTGSWGVLQLPSAKVLTGGSEAESA